MLYFGATGTMMPNRNIMVQMLIRALIANMLLSLPLSNAFAEIEKIAIPGEKGMSLYWRPDRKSVV